MAIGPKRPRKPKPVKVQRDDTERPPKPDRKWIVGRLDGVGLSTTKAAERLDKAQNVFLRMLNGTRPIRVGEAVAMARLLRTPLDELVRHLGYDVPPSSVPIIGIVTGDGRVSLLPPAQQTRIEGPTGISSNFVALEARTAHTPLALYHGTVLYYVPSEGLRPDAFGRLSVIEVADETAAIVGILDKAGFGRAAVTVYGGIARLETASIISASPVRWTRLG